jgi:hypothetical protein
MTNNRRSLLMRSLASLILLFLAAPAFAGSETGTVVFAHGTYGSGASSAGVTFLFLEGGVKTGNPACSTNGSGERWAINNDWPGAKIQIATLLAAFVAGKRVSIIGANSCLVWGDTETVVDVRILD